MAKLDRKNQKIFAVNAASSTLGVIGSLRAGSPAYSSDVETMQSLSNYTDGFSSVVIGSNSPCLEDMNSLHHLTTRQLAYIMERGIPEWNASTTYYTNSIVLYGKFMWRSIVDSNLNNAVTDITNWEPYSLKNIDIDNLGLSASVGSNQLTVAVKDKDGNDPSALSPVLMSLRSPTVTTGTSLPRTISSALSVTVPQYVTLGTKSGLEYPLYIYAFDSNGSGTMKLAISSDLQDESNVAYVRKFNSTVTLTIASPCVVTETGHNRQNGDIIKLNTTGALPTGLDNNGYYKIVNASTNTYQLTNLTTFATVNTSGSQSGIHTVSVYDEVLSSDNYYSGVSIKLIGYIKSTQATAGTWVTSPSLVSSDKEYARNVANTFIGAKYQRSSAQSISNADMSTIFNFDTKIYDTHNCVVTGAGTTTTGWKFIAPKTGYYKITCMTTLTTGGGWGVGEEFSIFTFKNGAGDGRASSNYTQAINSTLASTTGSNITLLGKFDYINVVFYQSSGGAINSQADGSLNWISVERIG